MTTKIVRLKNPHLARIVETDDTPPSLDPAIYSQSRAVADDRALAAVDGDIEPVVIDEQPAPRRRRRRRAESARR